MAVTKRELTASEIFIPNYARDFVSISDSINYFYLTVQNGITKVRGFYIYVTNVLILLLKSELKFSNKC